ncbi:MAG: hypothetical protein Q9Q40_00540 [Acidobacteriota bacterium]|nr:hypothetical protein [Acidobacteriota bacterium]
MAVSGQRSALLRGLRPVRGSLRLIGLRWILLVLAGAPAMLVMRAALASGAGRSTWLTASSSRLDLPRLITLFMEIGPAAGAAIAITAALALLGQQVLTAGAIVWLDRVRLGERPHGAFHSVVAEGTPWLWTLLRVALLAVLLDLLGLGVITLAAGKIALHGLVAGWSSVTLDVRLPRLHALAMAGWIALVGAGAFWCRLVMVADGRRRVRSAFFVVLRAWRRAPLAGPLVFIASTWLLQAGLGAGLYAWRQHPSATAAAAMLRLVAWLVLLLLPAALWHWLLRSALLTYTAMALFDIRSTPDRPWYLLRRLLRRPLPEPGESAPEGPVVVDSNLHRGSSA